jgi:solute carrier family 25 uncoupling protein 8/9
MLHCIKVIMAEEGVGSLFKGLTAGLQRQIVFASLRIGLYEPVKQLYVGENHVGMIPLSKRILAALTTGAIGITVANPTDVIKIRFQADGKLPENQRRYRTVS